MKQARTAMRTGLFRQVLVLAKRGQDEHDLPEHRTPEEGITIRQLSMSGGPRPLRALRWMWRVLRACLDAQPTVLSVHHILLLPLGALIKAISGAELVYDAHELETESALLSKKPILKQACKLIEAALIGACNVVIVVNEPIAAWYRVRYLSTRVEVIHNYPRVTPAGVAAKLPDRPLRALHNIEHHTVVFIYQGVLSPGRGLLLLLEVFTSGRVPGAVFVVMGYGELEEIVKAAAARSPYVRFQPAVPADQIVAYTASADVGLCLIEPICLSYELSLPNKLFEYIQAGIPVVVSASSKAMVAVISERRLGTVTELKPEAIVEVLNGLVQSDRTEMAAAARASAPSMTWEAEEPKLVELYFDLIESRANRRP